MNARLETGLRHGSRKDSPKLKTIQLGKRPKKDAKSAGREKDRCRQTRCPDAVSLLTSAREGAPGCDEEQMLEMMITLSANMGAVELKLER
ncbi:hypothetical protein CEXT_160961 [Caerostris extrusa]|uniref:Uncharacterized protein n=1 Tax=Caerostris extrusa TaxID=172846 RepID=A0AAV4WDS5_CAEEX|nr:hypothetical protein CEXT_160961 [Caerostris extrusa]